MEVKDSSQSDTKPALSLKQIRTKRRSLGEDKSTDKDLEELMTSTANHNKQNNLEYCASTGCTSDRNSSPIQRTGTKTFLSNFVIPKKKNRDTETQSSKCPHCLKSFSRPSLLDAHLPVHGTKKNFHKSDKRDRSFATKNRTPVRLHRVSTRRDERPFVCPECDVSFKSSCALRVHLMTHTGEKPFVCSECSARFRHKYTLKIHFMIHTGEKPFSCAQCGEKFRLKRYLAFHMVKHTMQKPAACGECGARFRDNTRLKIHLRKHTGETGFECHHCKKKFMAENTLEKHLLRHSS